MEIAFDATIPYWLIITYLSIGVLSFVTYWGYEFFYRMQDDSMKTRLKRVLKVRSLIVLAVFAVGWPFIAGKEAFDFIYQKHLKAKREKFLTEEYAG